MEKIIVLPEKEEMLERLKSMNSERHLCEKFYPILLEEAGNELVARGVVMMLTLAINDYTNGMPPMMAAMLFIQADKFIDALVDDPKVATEAKGILKAAFNKG